MSVEYVWQGSYPPGVPRELDVEPITMPEILTQTAGRFPNVTALVFMGKKITYRELEAAVNRFARALTALGVKAGDKVGILLPNMPQLVIAGYAAMRIGAVAVPHNPLAAEEDLVRQCGDAGPAVLITLDLLFPRALDVKEKTGLRSVIICHVPDFLPFPGNFLLRYAHKDLYRKIAPQPGIHEFLALLGAHPGTPVENRARWEEVGAILHTDGTTGAGKGVMLTHANLSCSARQLRAWLPGLQDGKESVLAAIPFFHGAGWTAIQDLSILAGWTDILVPRPEAQVVMEIMGKNRPTLLPAMPGVYSSLLAREAFRKMDFSRARAFLSGAAPLPRQVIGELRALKDVPVITFYGLAENAFAGTATAWSGPEKRGSAGLPLPGTDLKIVDPETGTRTLPAGEAGEICIKGPQVMKGYCKANGEEGAAIREGWLFTGDVGSLDGEGCLTVLDRKADRIVTDGHVLYPAEIDEALLTHPSVLEACTIGIPDAQRGQAVKAYVVLRPGETAEAQEIVAHCKARLAPGKVLHGVAFIDELPKSAGGKILRREVHELDKKKQAGKK